MREKATEGIALLIPLLAFFLVAILISPCNPWGDEAWYYYISKTLYWNWDPHLSFLPPIRWAFMLMLHPFTQNIWTFRVAYAVLSALLLALALLKVGKGKKLALLAGALAYYLNPLTTFYGFRVFTSVLGGSLATLSLAFQESTPLSLALALLSVGAWEGMLFPFAALSIIGLIKKDFKLVLYVIPVALALSASYDNLLFHKSPPGWAKGPITFRTLITLFLPLAPFLLYLYLKEKKWDELIVAFSMPLGLIINNVINGTLVETWYQVPALAIYSFYFIKSDKANTKVSIALILLSLAMYIPLTAYVVMNHHVDCCDFKVVSFLEVSHQKALLYKPFWAYSKYPYGKVASFTCYSVDCLKWYVRTHPRVNYVVSWEELGNVVKGLKLTYHEGSCYLYKVLRK